MSSRGLSQGSSQMIPHSLAIYEECIAKGENLYLDAEDFSDIIHYYLILKLHDKAELAIDKGLAIHPTNWKILLEKAYYLFDRGDLDECKEILANISEQNEEDVILLQVDILLLENKVNQARELLSIFENKSDFSLLSSIFYLVLDYDLLEDAEKWLGRINNKYKNSADYIALTADLYIAKKDYINALSSFELLIQYNPFNELYFWGQAKCYFELDQYYDCINSSLLGLAVNDSLDDLYIIMGQAYYRMDLLDNAVACFEKARDISDKEPDGLKELIEQIRIDQINIKHYQSKGEFFNYLGEDDADLMEGGLMSMSQIISIALTLNRAKYYPKDERFSSLNIPHDILYYIKNNSKEVSNDVVLSLDPSQELIEEDKIRQQRDWLAHQFGLVEDSQSEYTQSALSAAEDFLNEYNSRLDAASDIGVEDDLDADEQSMYLDRFNLLKKYSSIEFEQGEAYILDSRSVFFLNNILTEYTNAKNAGDTEKLDQLLFGIGWENFPAPVLEVLVDLFVVQKDVDTVNSLIDEIEVIFGTHKSHALKKALVNFYNSSSASFDNNLKDEVNRDQSYLEIEKKLRQMNLNFLADNFVSYLEQK